MTDADRKTMDETVAISFLSGAKAHGWDRYFAAWSNVKAEIAELQAIVDAAWDVRREEFGYTPAPDLILRKMYRDRLYEMLDKHKAAESAGRRKV